MSPPATVPGFPAPSQGIVAAYFIVSDDVERSRRFYTEVLGGQAATTGEPSYVALANGWIIINRGGGPTDDQPTVTLEVPPVPDRTSSFLNLRVALAARGSSPNRSTTRPRSGATSAIRTVT